MDQVLYGIDYIEYYFYWIYYKFIGYPFNHKNMLNCCNVFVLLRTCFSYSILYMVYSKGGKRSEDTTKLSTNITRK